MVGVAGLFAQEPDFEHADLVDKGLIFLGLLGLFNQGESAQQSIARMADKHSPSASVKKPVCSF